MSSYVWDAGDFYADAFSAESLFGFRMIIAWSSLLILLWCNFASASKSLNYGKYKIDPNKEIFIKACEEAGSYINNLTEDDSNEVFEISKNIASQIGTKTAVIYAGSDLTYLVSRRWKTQINENSKSKAYVGFMPEVHHNEILSWEADQEGSKNNFILILLRGDDHKKIDNRFEFTKEIIGSKVDTIDVRNISSENLIKDLFHLVLIGDLVSVNLADHLNIDPFNIDAIENLKKKLKG